MEVEVKARVGDLYAIRKKLEAMGARFGSQAEHIDEYFKPKGFDSRPSVPGDFILRIRTSGKFKTLTFKALTDVQGAWIEHETEINNKEEMRKILEAIGMVSVFTLRKRRTAGEMGWFEVMLDDVQELGRFIEVALESDEGEKEAARKKIIDFIKKLGIDEKFIEKRGYGEIMGEKLGHRFEGMR